MHLLVAHVGFQGPLPNNYVDKVKLRSHMQTNSTFYFYNILFFLVK